MEVDVDHVSKGPNDAIALEPTPTGLAIVPPIASVVREWLALIGGAEQRGAFRVKVIYFHTRYLSHEEPKVAR